MTGLKKIVALVGLASLTLGIIKLVGLPHEQALISDAGLNMRSLRWIGLLQILGALFLVFQATRLPGSVVIAGALVVSVIVAIKSASLIAALLALVLLLVVMFVVISAIDGRQFELD